jgi:hypothetical protein
MLDRAISKPPNKLPMPIKENSQLCAPSWKELERQTKETTA